MTSKSRLVAFLAAGAFLLTAAAQAHTLMAPDPNLALSTVDAASWIGEVAANGRQLAVVPDPNLGPSTADVEAAIPAMSANTPELAAAPDPNLGAPIEYGATRFEKMVAQAGRSTEASAQ
ncbi:MAG TPA: hypothetical protein VG496_11385 [Myxococcales bacterium]|nr:hypothetical protein [Myxococcales bacterium]